MKRLRVGWRLLGQSWGLLDQDRELIALPAVGGLFGFALGALVYFAFYRHHGLSDFRGARVVLVYPVFLVGGLPVTFANAAVVAATCERLNGGDPTIRSALGQVWRRKWVLLGWSVLGGLVGVVTQAVLERFKVGGRIAVWLVGLAWTLAITFVIPVLMFEERSPVAAVKRSASLFRERWGESVGGQGALVGATGILAIPVVLVGTVVVAVAIALLPAAVAVVVVVAVLAVTWTLLLGVVGALDAVFKAALYRYAVTGQAVGPFGTDELSDAFRPRRRWFRR
jgi:hypothetical protein